MGGTSYEVKYLVPTASGSEKEHSLKVGSYAEYSGTINMCKKLGYKLVINPMCTRCTSLGYDCHGEANHVYTGCVGRKVAKHV